ncbi:MAG TPA: alpha/beta hydrolase [bacterium]|nr:alpha/beta hydrolase [bacterium]
MDRICLHRAMSSVVCLALLLTTCASSAQDDTSPVSEISLLLEELEDSLPDLDIGLSLAELTDVPVLDENLIQYFRYYDLDIPGVEHFFGGVSIEEHRIAAHVFLPMEPVGTVVIAHGYFDHVGAWNHAIWYLVGESFAVLAFDFPGHGLSSGESGNIEDFSEYLAVFSRFVDLARAQLPGPVHFVGHSMGAGIVIEYLLTYGKTDDQRVVLIAPSIRSSKWVLSRIGNFLIRPFTNSVSRVFRASTHDKEFLEFRKYLDPLQPRNIPLQWFEELVEWNGRMVERGVSEAPLRVIQGTSDGTVDFSYNIGYLEDRFPNLDLIEIEGGEHHLINETPLMREEVFRLVGEYLRG